MRSTAALVVFVAGACAILPAAQRGQAPPPRPQFRTGVEVVEVDVSVLDSRRRPVRGLSASDFTVLENGRPQDMVSFVAVDVPSAESAASGWLRDVAPDIRSNLASADRLIVLVLDDAQVRSGPQHTRAVKDMARGVINRLGPTISWRWFSRATTGARNPSRTIDSGCSTRSSAFTANTTGTCRATSQWPR